MAVFVASCFTQGYTVPLEVVSNQQNAALALDDCRLFVLEFYRTFFLLRSTHTWRPQVWLRAYSRIVQKALSRYNKQNSPRLHPGAQRRRHYRHVVAVRNIHEAVASGYLHHQSGHECWLTFNGYSSAELGMDEKVFDYNIHVPDMPPRHERSICTYLEDENLQHGMTVYIDVALHKWHGGIEEYLRENDVNRVMMVCFEDLSDPTQQELWFCKIMDWLFPGGHEYQMPIQHPHQYSGGHSTSHDATLRSNLTSLVKRLDAQMFDGSLSKLQALFQCPSDRGRIQP